MPQVLPYIPTTMMQAAPVRKRRRSSETDRLRGETEPADKKARPTLGLSSFSSDSLWQPQDIYSSPSRSYHSQQAKYDSDDQSSMLSEPGSPQALSADEEDADMMMSEDSDSADFSQPTGPGSPSSSFNNQGLNPLRPPWKIRTQTQSSNTANRIPTPIVPPIPRPKTSPIQTHIRRRHPQENLGSSTSTSDRLDVPSPIDEDEVPTPPSAAEAAGSQLELLSVSDVEMQGVDDSSHHHPLPQIALSLPQSSTSSNPTFRQSQQPSPYADGPGSMMVRKQRQRSGALSSGCGSPMRDSASASASSSSAMETAEAGINKRGISMGFRPDCEKCRLRVPGHMNHFF